MSDADAAQLVLVLVMTVFVALPPSYDLAMLLKQWVERRFHK